MLSKSNKLSKRPVKRTLGSHKISENIAEPDIWSLKDYRTIQREKSLLPTQSILNKKVVAQGQVHTEHGSKRKGNLKRKDILRKKNEHTASNKKNFCNKSTKFMEIIGKRFHNISKTDHLKNCITISTTGLTQNWVESRVGITAKVLFWLSSTNISVPNDGPSLPR